MTITLRRCDGDNGVPANGNDMNHTNKEQRMSAFLVIQHESYDSSTVFGIFDSFNAARACAEKEWAEAHMPDIEEWEGATMLARYENWSKRPTWEMSDYRNGYERRQV
jgi:hypothetical protein